MSKGILSFYIQKSPMSLGFFVLEQHKVGTVFILFFKSEMCKSKCIQPYECVMCFYQL